MELQNYINNEHSSSYKCKYCGEMFSVSWKMEAHVKLHENVSEYNCSICEKQFYVKWRLNKHTESHSIETKFCHYFNNQKLCPNENIGCKSKHEVSPPCKFRSMCNFDLCQYSHNSNEEISARNSSLETDVDYAIDTIESDNEDIDWVNIWKLK